jgi:murein L,D-transpeptidase YafK
MTRLDMDKRSPIMLRIYKEDNKLEVWKETRDLKAVVDYIIDETQHGLPLD